MASRTTRASNKRKTETESSPPQSSSATTMSGKRRKQQTSKAAGDTMNSKASVKKSSKPSETLQIEEETGDIFEAPPNTLIIHACNCQGSWGAGIAKAFKDRYPKAFVQHAHHCDEHGNSLLDSAQLIPPVDSKSATRKDDTGNDNERVASPQKDGEIKTTRPKHFVGCLFTSRHYGRKKDSPSRILAATKPAMLDLLQQVGEWNRKADEKDRVGEVRMCKINSGLFAVPWEKTREVLESIDATLGDVKIIKVVSPPS